MFVTWTEALTDFPRKDKHGDSTPAAAQSATACIQVLACIGLRSLSRKCYLPSMLSIANRGAVMFKATDMSCLSTESTGRPLVNLVLSILQLGVWFAACSSPRPAGDDGAV